MQTKTFLLDQTAPTITTNIADGAVFTQGQPVPLTFSCADEAGGSGIAATGAASARRLRARNLPTGTAGMQVLTITATDAVGNVTVKTVNYRVLDAVNTPAPSAAPSARRSVLTLGAAGDVRRVHAGRRPRLHGLDDGQRGLHRG